MPLAPNCQKFIDAFLRTTAPLKDAYLNSSCCYVAFKTSEGFAIAHAKIFLSPTLVNAPLSHFQSENVSVGHYRLNGVVPQQITTELLAGKLKTPHGEFKFSLSENSDYGASYIPFHPDGLRTQRRISVLRLFGGRMLPLPQPDIDWEIKASDRPYDGIQELMSEYMLGTLIDSTVNVEFVAMSVAEVNTAKSVVNGDKAKFHIVAGKGIETSELRIGYRLNALGRVSVRSVLPPDAVSWSVHDDIQHGEATIDVPSATAVNAVVSYKGVPQHHWWFFDPSTSQNFRRAAYETFDPGLGTLTDILSKAQGRNPEVKQLESAVAWLLWLLGFSPAHLGGTPRTTDAVDLIVTTPAGHFAVIECTSGLLKAENKLALLHERAEAVRRSLAASNQSFRRVLAVIITSKTRADVKPDLEQASRLGVLVITNDEFEQIIGCTMFDPNPDRIYDEAEAKVRAASPVQEIQ